MQPLASLVALVLLCSAQAALDLPSYLKACNRDDPKFNECAMKSAIASIPKLIQGDRKYSIPPLDPLEVVEIVVNTGGNPQAGLKLTFKNAKFYGLKNAVIKSAKFEIPKNHAEVKVFVPRCDILSQYTVNGKILVVPITGNGDANITLTDLLLDIGLEWKMVKKADGLEYIMPSKATIKYDVKKTYFHLENLFNGNKLLGDNMNKFLNDNSEDVVKEVGPALAEALTLVVKQILEGITTLVPYNSIFPTKS